MCINIHKRRFLQNCVLLLFCGKSTILSFFIESLMLVSWALIKLKCEFS